jgi:hypothetical protein
MFLHLEVSSINLHLRLPDRPKLAHIIRNRHHERQETLSLYAKQQRDTRFCAMPVDGLSEPPLDELCIKISTTSGGTSLTVLYVKSEENHCSCNVATRCVFAFEIYDFSKILMAVNYTKPTDSHHVTPCSQIPNVIFLLAAFVHSIYSIR